MSEISIHSFLAVIYKLNKHDKAEWESQGNGKCAETHIFYDAELNHYRIVSYVEESGQVVLNKDITSQSIWIQIGTNFLKTTDITSETMGIYFKNNESLKVAKDILNDILMKLKYTHSYSQLRKDSINSTESNQEEALSDEIIKTINTTSALSLLPVAPPWNDTIRRAGQSSSTTSLSKRQQVSYAQYMDDIDPKMVEKESQEQETIQNDKSDFHKSSTPLNHLKRIDQSSLEKAMGYYIQDIEEEEEDDDGIPALCGCNIFKACMTISKKNRKKRPRKIPTKTAVKILEIDSNSQRKTERTTNNLKNISIPYQSRQDIHVTFNTELARYEGLPSAWKSMNMQFGVPLEAVPKKKVPGYDEKLPAVLQMMKEYLFLNYGHCIEGIFRIAPDKDKCLAVKESINEGTFHGCDDVNIISNLIKVWFRDLPESLFSPLPVPLMDKISKLHDPEEIMDEMNKFPEPNKSLIFWLLDVMSEVVKNEKINKMTSKNMAIVMSPNLFSVDLSNPMAALSISQMVANFTTVILNTRLRMFHHYNP